MKTTYHFSVDLGATSGRTILARFDGTKVEMEEITRFKYPMLPIRGHLFWNLPLIYEEILKGLHKCQDRELPISSIGIDSWGCDVAYFYKDGTLAGLPYCYRDSHTDGAAERFCNEFGRDRVYARTGIQFMDFNTLFQLYTLREKNPEVLDAADKILFIPDALAYMLTGNAVMEYTVATTSQMVNVDTGDLDDELLSKIGLNREKFGRLVRPGEQIGTYDGIPVVAVAGHDTASAVIGVPSPDKEYAYLSCGTWSLLGVESPEAIVSEKSYEYNFTNEGGIEGTTRFLKNICGLWIFERCMDEFAGLPDDIAKVSAMCMESDCDSIINPDDARFAHPRRMTSAINDYCMETGQNIPKTPADYIRVVYRSLAKRYGTVSGWLRELSPVEIKRLHVIGGGSMNPYIMQFTADELGIPVVAGPKESTALGNVLVQLKACGLVGDLGHMRHVAINSTETKTYNPEIKH